MSTKNPKTPPDFGPWPKHPAYVGRAKVRGSLDGIGETTLDNYIKDGLLPKPVAFGPNRVGWPVDVITTAIEQLPGKVAALRKRPRRVAGRRQMEAV